MERPQSAASAAPARRPRPRMVNLARDRTAGVYPYLTSAEHIRQVREHFGPEPFLAADLPVVLARDRTEARTIVAAHSGYYLRTENYRNNLLRLGWKPVDLDPPGSDELMDAIVAWAMSPASADVYRTSCAPAPTRWSSTWSPGTDRSPICRS